MVCICFLSCLCLLNSLFGIAELKPKRAIVIGASSGMGRELAKLLVTDGYIVGLTARRLELLQQLQKELHSPSYVLQIDASRPEEAVKKLKELILKMGGLDLLIITITGAKDTDDADRDWLADKSIFDVDILGFFALARTGINFFEQQGYGHLVGFTSIDCLRGVASCPVYSAAKAFCSRYLEAERNRCIQKKLSITITDIMPGWVNSQDLNMQDYNQKHPRAYWVDSLSDAAHEIFAAIKNKMPLAYSSKRWQSVADMIKVMPDDLYNALGGL